jgi:hypothetical protein
VMNEPNRHFEINWVWEDSLAHSAQALAAGADGPGRQETGGDPGFQRAPTGST